MNKYNGFSLIEMAIALAIIGYLISGLFKPMVLTADYKKINNTDKTLEQIKGALVSFAIVNNRLPCPARCTKYKKQCVKGSYNSSVIGIENSALCTKEGYLPWADLGVGRYDGWNRPFRYRVDKNYSATNIKINVDKKFTIKNKQSVNNFTTTSSNRHVIAIIFSYGKDGEPNPKNDTIDLTYISGQYQTDENDYFDDRLTWLSKNSLTSYLATTRDLPQ
ncbi:prepilin-type N-terminal cleavage/methylation domain-containing protein [Thiotrichales bacterium HSG1]|nr:prepilin-type N-terminal cleavage/methylation domain-containing protein [Thiotrichales bacterium HSG1]